jgi:hypothetical protein
VCRSEYKALKISTRIPGDTTIKASNGLAVFLWLAQAVRRVLNDKVCRYCMMSVSTSQFPPLLHSQLNMDWTGEDRGMSGKSDFEMKDEGHIHPV